MAIETLATRHEADVDGTILQDDLVGETLGGFTAGQLLEVAEAVTADLIVPESLDPALRGVGAVFLVWTAPPTTAPGPVSSVPRRMAPKRRFRRISSGGPPAVSPGFVDRLPEQIYGSVTIS